MVWQLLPMRQGQGLPMQQGQGLPMQQGQALAPGCPPGSTAPECQSRSGSSSSSGSRGAAYNYAGREVATGNASTAPSRAVTPTAQGAEALTRVASTSSISRGGLGAAGRGFSSASS